MRECPLLDYYLERRWGAIGGVGGGHVPEVGVAGKSPTQRSLEWLRDDGWLPWVVERTITRYVKRDLWHFADLLAIKGEEVLAVQVTSAANMAARVGKVTDSEHVEAVRKAGILIHVHGWRKNAAGRWVLRVVDVS